MQVSNIDVHMYAIHTSQNFASENLTDDLSPQAYGPQASGVVYIRQTTLVHITAIICTID